MKAWRGSFARATYSGKAMGIVYRLRYTYTGTRRLALAYSLALLSTTYYSIAMSLHYVVLFRQNKKCVRTTYQSLAGIHFIVGNCVVNGPLSSVSILQKIMPFKNGT